MRFGTTILWRRLCRHKIRPATRTEIDRRSGTQTGQPQQIEQQQPGERAAGYCRVHDPLAAKRAAELGRIQHSGRRQFATERRKLVAPAFRAIQRKQQKPGPAPAYRLTDPLETGDSETGPTGEADCIATAPRQEALDTVGKPGRRRNRPSRRPRENPLCHRPLHYIATRRQPQTPSGQPCFDIRHDRTVGTHDKPQQRTAVAHLAGHDAAALRVLGLLGGWRRR
jgi:hypothetical protein